MVRTEGIEVRNPGHPTRARIKSLEMLLPCPQTREPVWHGEKRDRGGGEGCYPRGVAEER